MGQVAYRANLSAANFPMTIAEGGRTVIVPGPDNNFDRRVDPTGAQKDAGIPQALYLENVFPTISGYQSVGYINPGSLMSVPVGQKIAQHITVPVSATAGVVVYEQLYITDSSVTLAGYAGNYPVTFPAGGSLTYGVTFSTAVVGSTCYLFDGIELYTVHNTGVAIEITKISASVLPVNFFSLNGIICICGSRNYLIALSSTTAFYSSTTTPTDFTASLVSGAGEISVGNVISRLIYAHGTQDGFYLFSPEGAYYAQYTGNARYPWKFNIVRGAVGLDESVYDLRKRIAFNGASDEIYVVEKDLSFKVYAKTQATSVLHEITELLQKKKVQSLYDFDTDTFTTEVKTTEKPSVYLWDSRYLFISIDETEGAVTPDYNKGYSAALVFDVTTNRLGKLKLPFKYFFATVRTLFANLKTQMIFIDPLTNVMKILSLDIYNTEGTITSSEVFEPHRGVLVLGKFQYVRSRKIKLEQVEFEGAQNTAVISNPNFSCVIFPSQDGRNFDTTIVLTASAINGGLVTFPVHATAQNHSVGLKGAFSADTLQLRFTPAGDR